MNEDVLLKVSELLLESWCWVSCWRLSQDGIKIRWWCRRWWWEWWWVVLVVVLVVAAER